MSSPTLTYGVVCWLVGRLLTSYLTVRDSGYMCTNDTGILVGRRPDTLRGADIMLFLTSKSWDQMTKYVEDVPQLVVEVLSPTDRPNRVARRVRQYLDRGVPLVWTVDFEDRTVAVYRPDELSKTLDESDELTGNGVLPDFRCRVADLFALPGQPPAPPTP